MGPTGRADGRPRGVVWSLSALVAVTTMTGCGSPQDSTVREAARAFTSAVQRQDGAAACSLLAPRTKAGLEQSAGQACRKAVLAEDLPSYGASEGAADVFGTAARFTTDDDALFLARFQGGWKVSAAGCTRTANDVYDCLVKGS
jgi:hypothetical protein